MRFSCDHCNARYSIPDERVRGRVLKIRCSKCSTVITVREAPKVVEEVQESTRVASSADMLRLARNPSASPPTDEATRAGSPPGPIWYVLVNGQQIGPVDLEDLQKRARKGDVNAKSFVWRDGMGDWKRIADVSDLAAVMRPVAPPASKPSLPPVPKGGTLEVPAVKPRGVPADVFDAADAPPFASADDIIEPTQDDPSEERTMMATFAELQQNNAAAQPAKKASKSLEPVAAPFEVPVDLTSDEVAPKAESKTKGKAAPASGAEKPASKPSAREVAVAVAENKGKDNPLLEPMTNPFQDLAGLGLGKSGKKEKGDKSADEPKRERKADVGPLDPFMAAANGGAAKAEAEDPFGAAVKHKDSSKDVPRGEETKFFITQAGIENRNPKWKVALFVLLIVGLPVAVVYSLSQFRVINIDVPVTVDEEGNQVKASVFSTEGVQALRDMLLRKPPKSSSGQPGQAARRVASTGTPRPAAKADGGMSKAMAEAAKDLYQKDDGINVGPRVQKDKMTDSVSVNRGSGLDEAVVAEKVHQSQAAFQSCVEVELHKNPNVRLGKMDLTANVGSSGTVVSASIDRVDIATTELGRCLIDRAKRMVFPASSDGASTEIHIPLHFQTQM